MIIHDLGIYKIMQPYVTFFQDPAKIFCEGSQSIYFRHTVLNVLSLLYVEHYLVVTSSKLGQFPHPI